MEYMFTDRDEAIKFLVNAGHDLKDLQRLNDDQLGGLVIDEVEDDLDDDSWSYGYAYDCTDNGWVN